jgi:hypothetical protein
MLTGGASDATGDLFGLSRADKTFIFHDGANGLGLGIGTLNNQPMVFGTNNTERFRVSGAGAITFNTSTNSYTFPSTRATAGQVLSDAAGDGTLSWASQGRAIDALITTAQNSGTSETDLFTKTIAANTITADKQTLNFEIDGEFNDNTATAQLKLYFAGNVTLNTGAINISTASTAWKLTGYIIRTSSSTAHVTYELNCPGLATPLFLGYSNLTSLDFTATNVFKITAQAGGAGGGTADITAHSWQVLHRPQP